MALQVGTDLPVVEIRYENLSLTCNSAACRGDVASGAAGAVPPSLPGYLASIVTGPLRAVARGVKGKAGAGSSPAPVTGPEAPAVPGHCKTNAAGQAASQGGFPVLNCISGRLRPGTACLILGPPGAGSSSMLRLLSGRLQPSSSMLLGGQLTYNGRSAGQLKALDGVELRKLAAYSPEDDEHEFLLTVRETFDFAYKAAVLPPPADAVAAAAAAASSAAPAAATGGSNAFSFPTGRWTPPDADVMCNIMGLKEAAHTKIGNALIRGVSGGQKRRVTVGEACILNSRVLALDGPTNGLDSVTANAVCKYVADWAHHTQGIAIATLQQPQPETFALFDEVILLAEGRVLYHGPTAYMDVYFARLGYVRPSYLEAAGWAVEITSSPVDAAQMSLEDRAAAAAGAVHRSTSTRSAGAGQTASAAVDIDNHAAEALAAAQAVPPFVPAHLTVDALANHWQQSAWARTMMAEGALGIPGLLRSEDAAARSAGERPGLTPSAAAAALGAGTVKQATAPGVCSAAGPKSALVDGIKLHSAYAQRQYGSLSTTGFADQVAHTTRREMVLAKRNWLYTAARLANAVVMGLILGSVFVNLAPERNPSDVGLIVAAALFGLTFVAFLNNAITPIAFASRGVAYKHTSAGLFSEYSLNLAVLAGHLPISIVANAIFATILYFLVGFDGAGGRWAFFVLIVLLMDLAISTLYRSMAYAVASQETAMIASSVFIAVGMATGGYFVLRGQLPDWMLEFLYVSPFFWSTQSLTSNEFAASKYDTPMPGQSTTTVGQAYMQSFTFMEGVGWKWAGAGVLLAYYLLFGLLVQPLLLRYVRHDSRPGARRIPSGAIVDADDLQDLIDAAAAAGVRVLGPLPVHTLEDEEAAAEPAEESTTSVPAGAAAANPPPAHQKQPSAAHVQPAHGPAPANTATFTPVTLAFHDVSYYVPAPKVAGAPADAPKEKQLLRNVSGFCKPGTLTALCGSSGAGKTTLLDVLAFRKTTGRVTGSIKLNGVDATALSMARAGAFAEQFDAHLPTTTVREALHFSVALRTTPEQLGSGGAAGIVADALETLEMTRLADRRVSTLSSGELKRLSLGVELVSNKGLIFADEPTTGLSARAAAVVVRVLERICRRGCTVVCTIHQPSAHLFFTFSHLVLLAPGGWQVYFGPLGRHARSLVDYFESIPGAPRLPAFVNPATWMLEVVDSTRAVPSDAADPAAAEVVVAITVGTLASERAASPSSEPQLVSVAVSDTPSPDAAAPVTAAATPAPDAAAPASDAAIPAPETVAHLSTGAQAAVPISEAIRTTYPLMTAAQVAGVYAASPLAASLQSQLTALLQPGAVVAVPASATSNSDHASPTPTPTHAHPHSLEGLRMVNMPMQPLSFDSAFARPFRTQLAWVLRRSVVDSWRNAPYNGARLISIAFLGLFFGLLYNQLDFNTFQGVQSALGSILASAGFVGVIVFTIGVPLYMRYRASFYRERDAKFYSPVVHALSLLVTETVWVAMLALVFTSIFYWLIHFRAPAAPFFFYYLGLLICVLAFEFAALSAAAMFPSSIIAQLAGGVFLSVVFLFGGIFVPRPSAPKGWAWFLYIDFAYYVVRALSMGQFYCDTGDASGTCPRISIMTAAGPAQPYTYSYVSFQLDATYGQRWDYIGYSAIIMALMAVATVVIWRVFNHQKR